MINEQRFYNNHKICTSIQKQDNLEVRLLCNYIKRKQYMNNVYIQDTFTVSKQFVMVKLPVACIFSDILYFLTLFSRQMKTNDF